MSGFKGGRLESVGNVESDARATGLRGYRATGLRNYGAEILDMEGAARATSLPTLRSATCSVHQARQLRQLRQKGCSPMLYGTRMHVRLSVRV